LIINIHNQNKSYTEELMDIKASRYPNLKIEDGAKD